MSKFTPPKDLLLYRDKRFISEFLSWDGMKKRCYYHKHKNYHRYGGRGIKVCERWLESFRNFLEDMGPKPSSKHTIDRINVNGDYTLENCRWSTNKEQQRGRGNCIKLTLDGVTKFSWQWAEELGTTTGNIRARLILGWSDEKVLRTPFTRKKTGFNTIAFHGEIRKLTEWCRELEIDSGVVHSRLRHGWTVEEALTKPIKR